MGRWCCAGPPPACSTRNAHSAASRATSRCPSSSPRCTDTPTPTPPTDPKLSVPRHRVHMDRHRSSTRLGTPSVPHLPPDNETLTPQQVPINLTKALLVLVHVMLASVCKPLLTSFKKPEHD